MLHIQGTVSLLGDERYNDAFNLYFSTSEELTKWALDMFSQRAVLVLTCVEETANERPGS